MFQKLVYLWVCILKLIFTSVFIFPIRGSQMTEIKLVFKSFPRGNPSLSSENRVEAISWNLLREGENKLNSLHMSIPDLGVSLYFAICIFWSNRSMFLRSHICTSWSARSLDLNVRENAAETPEFRKYNQPCAYSLILVRLRQNNYLGNRSRTISSQNNKIHTSISVLLQVRQIVLIERRKISLQVGVLNLKFKFISASKG